jgi:hypothetical protein
MRRALAILEKNLGPQHQDTQTVQAHYEALLVQLGKGGAAHTCVLGLGMDMQNDT